VNRLQRVQYGNWVPGGVLRVYSRRYGVWHFGILTWLYGQPMVMHASKDRGHFVLTALAEFAEGEAVQFTWLPENFETQQSVLGRAESLLGKPFLLLDANCEDYVNWIVTGVARSPQREQVTLAAVLLAIIFGGFGDDFGGAIVRR